MNSRLLLSSLLLSAMSVGAFVPSIQPPSLSAPSIQQPGITTDSSSLRYKNDDESNDWNSNGSIAAAAIATANLRLSKAAKQATTSPIQEIESHIDWDELMLDSDDQLTIVKFYSTRCKACQRMGLKYQNLARKHNQVHFAAVEYGRNKQLCQELKINALPTVQLYYKGQILTSFVCPPSQYHLLQDALNEYMQMSSEDLKLAVQLEKGSAMMMQELADFEEEEEAFTELGLEV